MLDSFKPEYVEHTIYLKDMCKKYQNGNLETPLGFWGGMDTFFHGSSNKLAFFYLTDKSSWRWIRFFTWLKIFGRFPIDVLINLWNVVHGNTLFRTNNIPLDKLYMFDTDVKKPLHKDVDIKYISFHELDGIAHRHGTKSQEVINEIKRLDEIISKINWDMIMSDHGMIDITEFVRVPETEKCFIDSTLARYWSEKPENMPMDKCKPIKENKKYGDFIYLANPGVCFLPNYWQTKECKGMHGYDPKIRDMKAFYIIKKEGKKKDLTMAQLHEEIK